VLKPCLSCGEPSPASYCDEHKPKATPKASAHSRGYTHRWIALSRQARRLQPFCTDCLTPGSAANPLTLDHTPAAWAKVTAGKTLTLKDCANKLLVVRCLRCNVAAGAARGDNVQRQA
jgi:5-methylcytosine-specific restriction protein A